jgi:aryl-alcohol dehydrogenase-like predicted oxidoreductase
MDYVRLGATGLKVSRLCLGCLTCRLEPPYRAELVLAHL